MRSRSRCWRPCTLPSTCAERDGAIVILTGREGYFSAGFDLKVFAGGDVEQVLEMLTLGATLAERILAFATPVITACPGHTVAAGAFMTLAADPADRCRGPLQDRPERGEDRADGAVVRDRARPPTAEPGALQPSCRQRDDVQLGRGGHGWLPRRVVPADRQPRAASLTAAARTAELNAQAHTATKLRARAGALAAIRSGDRGRVDGRGSRRRAAALHNGRGQSPRAVTVVTGRPMPVTLLGRSSLSQWEIFLGSVEMITSSKPRRLMASSIAAMRVVSEPTMPSTCRAGDVAEPRERRDRARIALRRGAGPRGRRPCAGPAAALGTSSVNLAGPRWGALTHGLQQRWCGCGSVGHDKNSGGALRGLHCADPPSGWSSPIISPARTTLGQRRRRA